MSFGLVKQIFLYFFFPGDKNSEFIWLELSCKLLLLRRSGNHMCIYCLQSYRLICKLFQPNDMNHKEELYTICDILDWDNIFERLLSNINKIFEANTYFYGCSPSISAISVNLCTTNIKESTYL